MYFPEVIYLYIFISQAQIFFLCMAEMIKQLFLNCILNLKNWSDFLL